VHHDPPHSPPPPGPPPILPPPVPVVPPPVAAGDEPLPCSTGRPIVSMLVSLAAHVALLLALALIVIRADLPRRTALSFQAPSAEEEVVMDDALDPVELEVMAAPEPDAVEPLAPEPTVVEVDVAAGAPADIAAPPDVDLAALDDMADLMAPIGGRSATGGAGRLGGEIGRRLAKAGAQTGDIQVSLSWNNFNDLDLHVVAPSGEHIFFAHRQSACRGRLDVDMNAGGPSSREPVENVFWPRGGSPPGEYAVFVHHYALQDAQDRTPFEVHVLVGGRRQRLAGVVAAGDAPLLVGRFRRIAADDDSFVE